MLELLQHQHAGAAGDDEAVAIDVIGAGSSRGPVVELGRHGAHGVEQVRHRPVEILMAAGKDHVLLAPLDQLVAIADAMRRGRAGRRDRIVDAVDLEPGGQRCRRGRRHRLRYREGADALGAAVLQCGFGRLDDGAGGGAARAHDDAGALIGDVAFAEARIGDRLVHGDVVPGGTLAQEAHRAAVDHGGGVERRRAPDLATEAVLGEGIGKADAGSGVMQRGLHLVGIVADRRHDAEACDYDTSHSQLLPGMLASGSAKGAVKRPPTAWTDRPSGPSPHIWARHPPSSSHRRCPAPIGRA